MKVSVIIPVYNCAEYLEQCLGSVLNQTLQELEIICVDDGSTDESYELIEKYSKKDNRIRLYHQNNQGAGSARNCGITEAKGQFVIFLDADDYYYDMGALEKMYSKCIDNQVDVCGSTLKLMRQGEIIDDMTLKQIKEAAAKQAILEYDLFQFDYGYTGFLFARELLIKNNISFPSYRRFQDPPFLVRAMYAAKKFVFADVYLYCYRVPTMVIRYNRDKVIDLLKGLIDNMKFAYEHKLDKLFSTTLMRLEYEYYSTICHTSDKSDNELISMLQIMNEYIRKVLNDEEYMIRPLQSLLSEDKFVIENYEKWVIDTVKEQPYIYIYGAGGYSRKLIQFLREEKLFIKIKGVIISAAVEEGAQYEGIKLYSIQDLKVGKAEKIFLAVGAIFHKEIIDNLKKYGYKNYIVLDSMFLEDL